MISIFPRTRRDALPALRRASLALLALLMLCIGQLAAAAERTPLVVFAASSLKESLDEAAEAYQRQSRQPVQVSYAASSALARQIAQGAPADVFVSADLEWVEWLQQRSLINAATRHALLGNTLVLVAPANSSAKPLQLRRGTALLPLLGSDGRIALALTSSVPAGKYAKAALEHLAMWKPLQGRIAEAENVRATLLLVARGETPLGVVYGSDARAEPNVKVLATFPAGSHPPIIYPLAVTATSGQPAQSAAFVRWLQTPPALAIFRRHGFSAP